MSDVLGAREQFEQRVGVYDAARFGRVITAMVSPFDDRGSLNQDVAAELATYLVDHGSEGLVLAGTTGESPTLTRWEEIALFTKVRDTVEVPILAGTGSNNTTEAVEITEEVTRRELADGLLVVSPYYNKPPQDGIYNYFAAVAESTDLPIIMYNIPGRTGGDGIANETMLRLAEIDNIVGLKDASGKPDNTAELAQELPEGFLIYSGDDSLNLRLARQAGAVGAISVASHWAGEEMQSMYDSLDEGNDLLAENINRRLIDSYDFESFPAAPNPIPTKTMMRVLGLQVGFGRSPMVLDSYDEVDARARAVWADLKGLPQ